MLTKEHILDKLSRHGNQLRQYGIVRIGLFGSYARQEQHEGSDIDVLVQFDAEKETFDNLIALSFFLENLFEGKKVDLATINGLSPYIGPKILREVAYAEIAA